MAHAPSSSSLPWKVSTGGLRVNLRLRLLAVGILVGLGSLAVPSIHPAGADQLGDAKAKAAAIAAQIQATDQRLQTLTDQYSAADYHLSQLNAQITQTQRQVTQAKAAVAKNQKQLQKQAIGDYTSSGTHSSVADLFTADRNAPGVRQEYSNLAAGNVSTLISKLHTSVTQLSSEQASLQQQQTQASQARDILASAKSQASTLVAQEEATKAGVDANIQSLIVQQQAAASAAAAAAFTAKVKAAQAAASASPAQAGPSTPQAPLAGGTGIGKAPGAGTAVVAPSAAPPPALAAGVAGAIQAAEREVGVPYLWGGASPSTGFDCSGLIMWAYAQVGIGLPHFSGAQFSSTVHIPFSAIQPGDLLFYGPQGADHEAMYVGGGQMIEAPHTGAFVQIVGVRTDSSTVVGRVQ